MVLRAQSTTEDYIWATTTRVIISKLKKTFIKSYRVERTNKAEIRPEEQSQKTRELSGEFIESNTVEWAIKTEIDARTEYI